MVRLYEPTDAEFVDRLLPPVHDVLLRHDRLYVSDSGAGAGVDGLLVCRPVGWIHQFILPSTLGRRSVGRRLLHYAACDVAGKSFRLADTMFRVDEGNVAMLRYVHDTLKARPMEGKLFQIPLMNLLEVVSGEDSGSDR